MAGVRIPLLLAALAFPLAGASHAQSIEELRDLSIEELSAIEVTSASKRTEPVSQVPASIFVITGDDILRSVATSIPELLRNAPNLGVQQIDARQYAVTARGFNGYETANKLLALIDGRSIYTTLHSGIFWELHSPLIEDLRQIEVVSGPGGTLYGPNAVNGVVNITSKPAQDTLGGLVRATVAANELTGAARYGFSLGDAGALRIYGTYVDRADLPAGSGRPFDDGYSGFQGGFRADLGTDASVFTLQGDAFNTDTRLIEGEGDKGVNLLARWTRQLTDRSSLQLQTYYDKFKRRFITVDDQLETIDASVQYNLAAGRHALVVGGGVRTTDDYFFNGLAPITLAPASRRLWIGNGFVQDRFALTDAVAVTAGVKVENSSFSGLEVMPNLRVAWHPSDEMLLWSAVSRAVRTPSRIDRNLQFPPVLATSPGFKSEKVTAIELGYRGQPTASTSLSLTAFYNLYDDLRTTELSAGGVLPIRLKNGLKGRSWGAEAWATQQVLPWWRLHLSASALGTDFEAKKGRVDLTGGESAGNDPDYDLKLRSQMNMGAVDLDASIRAVDDLSDPAVPAYVELEARAGWRVSDRLDLFVAGRNLLHARHAESGDPDRGQFAERSIYAGSRVRF